MRKEYWKKASDITVFLAIFCVFLLTSTSFSPSSYAEVNGSCPPPISGDWLVNNTTTVSNETIVLDGNLTIECGGILLLENVVLKMNFTEDGSRTIKIESSAELQIISSVVTSVSGSFYKFEVYGQLVVYQSTVEYLWGEDEIRQSEEYRYIPPQ